MSDVEPIVRSAKLRALVEQARRQPEPVLTVRAADILARVEVSSSASGSAAVVRLPASTELSPSVGNPRLQALVDLAREQAVAPVSVSIDDIRRGMKDRRHKWWTAATMAAAAVVIGALTMSLWQPERDASRAEVVTRHDGTEPREVVSTEPETVLPEDDADPVQIEVPDQPVPARPALAAGVKVRPLGADASVAEASEIEVLGPHEVQVTVGVYEVEVAAEVSKQLAIRVHERTLLVSPGARLRLQASEQPRFELERGQARWADDGPETIHAASRPSALELAREAEAELGAGDRDGAIAVLQTLVRTHPRSGAARAGLLDLARLHKAAGQPDRARCAYELYLQRWPTSRLRDDVQSALDKLGEGRACRGLQSR